MKNYYTVALREKTLNLCRYWLTNKILIHLYYENIMSHFSIHVTMKNRISYFFLFLPLFGAFNAVKGQECGYIQERNAEIERFTEGYVRSFHTQSRPRTVVKIPVVVHIIWRTAAENISDAQIRGQIDSLTKDFRKRNVDAANIPTQRFRDLAADCEIEFCLATRDTLGNPSTGIVRKQTTIASFGNEFEGTRRKAYYTNLGGDNAWRPDRYLNIWVCAFPEDGILGYSTPLSIALTKPAEDGCVVNCRAFGVSDNNLQGRNKGRTLVHEVGHYFNLLHIFGSESTCVDDDDVEDTPRQAGRNSFCPSFPAPQSCPNNGGDMFMNYMDYPYDECVLMFTKGQKARMWATLEGFRRDLTLKSAVCDPFVGTNNVVEAHWSFSPNPTASMLTIQMPDVWRNQLKIIQLTDITGRVLIKKVENTEGSVLSVQDVPKGLYFLSLSVDNQIFTKKIIVAK
jgi:Pregnancy-associated plasma protein-A/Secretion system C-terminal sorting domain